MLFRSDNETVRWISTGPTEVDVLKFRDAMAAGDFELAARIYSGDLLPACYDDWVLDERVKLRAEAYGALVRLTKEAESNRQGPKTLVGCRLERPIGSRLWISPGKQSSLHDSGCQRLSVIRWRREWSLQALATFSR